MKRVYEKPAVVHTEKIEARAVSCAQGQHDDRRLRGRPDHFLVRVAAGPARPDRATSLRPEGEACPKGEGEEHHPSAPVPALKPEQGRVCFVAYSWLHQGDDHEASLREARRRSHREAGSARRELREGQHVDLRMRGRSGHLLGGTAPGGGGARRGIGDHERPLRLDALNSGRRAFLLTGLGATIASLVGRVVFGAPQRDPGAPVDPSPGPGAPRSPRVCEVRSRELRAAVAGGGGRSGVSELLLGALSVLSGEDLPPLDALTELFPGDPPVTILVDAGASGPFTPLLANELAAALLDMGSAAGSVAIADASDAELAGGRVPDRPRGTRPSLQGDRAGTGVPGTAVRRGRLGPLDVSRS